MTPHGAKKGCNVLQVGKDVCRLEFTTDTPIPSTNGVLLKQLDTIRGETLVLELTDKNEIVAIELFAPGDKPCQPNIHTTEP